MKSKRLKILNGFILLTLLILNLLIFLNRDNGYAYTEVLNYNALYNIKENFQISRFAYNGNDSLSVFLNKQGGNVNWEITVDSLNPYASEGSIQLKLIEGKHEYRIKNIEHKDESFSLGLNYVTDKTYQKAGRKRASDVELLYSSAGLDNEQIQSKDFWKQSSALTTEEEVKDVSSILKNDIKILYPDSAIEKIKKIGAYILARLQSKQGTPSDTMDKLSPQQRFDHALNNHSKVWCGDFADIFSLYANTAGITTRLVCTEGEAHGIPKSGHSFNECYIPELKQWVFVDLTSGTLFVQNSQGNYLNSIDFYNAHLLRSSDLKVTKFENDSLFETPYLVNRSFYKDYFNMETYFVFYNAAQFSKDLYSFQNKWLRYIFKRPTFAVYANSSSVDNRLFYIKQGLFFSLLIFIGYLITVSFFTKLSKHKPD